ncbi:MAG: TMEM165/GDT1 family protein [Firmicutes bacterium]|nr:TMEM165/GDT1 family protein [Bacillota bacterium]
MVWKVILSTFCLVFVAELGDKTQLATMLLAAKSTSPWSVFIGAALALVMSSLVGVLAGEAITRIIPPNCIQVGAGVAFVVLGILLITGKF